MADKKPLSGIEFRRYLMTMSNKLLATDLKKLRFLCKDILTAQSLQKVTKGLHLFTELEKMMLLTKDNVSLVIELMEIIWRTDLVKITTELFGTASIPKIQPMISQYRRLLLTVALSLTEEDLDGFRCMACGYLHINIEEIQDVFELITILEKECVITANDVDVLIDILPTQITKDKVHAYKVGVLGQPTPQASPAAATQPMPNSPMPNSSSQHSQSNISSSAPYQANPNFMGASGTVPDLPIQYAPLPYHMHHPTVPGYPHYNPNMVQPLYHPGHQSVYPVPLQPSGNANIMGNAQQTVQHSGYMYVPTHQPLQLQGNASIPNPQQQTPPRNGRNPVENTSPPDPHLHSTPPMQDPRTNTPSHPHHDKVQPSATVRPLSHQQDEADVQLDTRQQSLTQSDSQADLHGIQPQSAAYDSSKQGSIHQSGQEVNRSPGSGGDTSSSQGDSRQAEDVVGLERKFESLRVDLPEDTAKVCLVSNTELAAVAASFDNFPTSAGNKSSEGQQMTGTSDLDRLLEFDNPNAEPSQSDIPPWDEDSMQHIELGPTDYKMSSNPRGLCLIINNEDFKKSRMPIENPTGTQLYREQLDDRPGSTMDAISLIQLFGGQLGLKLIRCKSNRTAEQMYNDLESVRKMDHRQYDCFVCCILTHGRMGDVYGVDGLSIEIKDLTGLFAGVKCQSLAGKPKVFFINACQGEARQIPVTPIQQDSPPSDNMVRIPNESDFLVCLSTVPGYVSFRSPDRGSWYVISLVAIMKKYHKDKDTTNLLYMVNDRLGRCCDAQGFKQCAFISSSLRRTLYLR